jgi:hypothetical protein
MRVNQNSSKKLDLYTKSNLTTLSSNSAEDRTTITKLSVFRIMLGSAAETQVDAGKYPCETDEKNRSKLNLCPHKYFTEHLVCVFKKQPFDSNWNKKTLSFLIR